VGFFLAVMALVRECLKKVDHLPGIRTVQLRFNETLKRHLFQAIEHLFDDAVLILEYVGCVHELFLSKRSEATRGTIS
jgi:hypothetical protein